MIILESYLVDELPETLSAANGIGLIGLLLRGDLESFMYNLQSTWQWSNSIRQSMYWMGIYHLVEKIINMGQSMEGATVLIIIRNIEEEMEDELR